ncbi:hypothetical protein BU17DRAFT_63977 [Hysterangium stoloniferum]|nr:hypothetical protein BU17DRAFT_63977 [Hysterangium stoloniferum]
MPPNTSATIRISMSDLKDDLDWSHLKGMLEGGYKQPGVWGCQSGASYGHQKTTFWEMQDDLDKNGIGHCKVWATRRAPAYFDIALIDTNGDGEAMGMEGKHYCCTSEGDIQAPSRTWGVPTPIGLCGIFYKLTGGLGTYDMYAVCRAIVRQCRKCDSSWTIPNALISLAHIHYCIVRVTRSKGIYSDETYYMLLTNAPAMVS